MSWTRDDSLLVSLLANARGAAGELAIRTGLKIYGWFLTALGALGYRDEGEHE